MRDVDNSATVVYLMHKVKRTMNKGSLLLVDDDRHVLDSMADWLREQGYEVVESQGRDDAIRQVDQRTFDLVLADIRLQDGDGFEVLAHCRENHPDTTVILPCLKYQTHHFTMT